MSIADPASLRQTPRRTRPALVLGRGGDGAAQRDGSQGSEARSLPFLRGEAAALPIADAVADAAISVFGVIFAADAPAAVAEMVRVSAPGARIVLAAWLPTGPRNEVVTVRRQAVAPPRKPHPRRRRFPGTNATPWRACLGRTGAPSNCRSTGGFRLTSPYVVAVARAT
ncbi:MAG: methyltransferase domain-containing protein [Actinomycetota bacterium]|nr:methyltransferase domain-containing protein [Actinomycetota bacterium]